MLLIDADSIAFRAAAATEKTVYVVEYHDGTWKHFPDAKSAKEDMANQVAVLWNRKDLQPEIAAVNLVDIMVLDILARYPSHGAKLYLSGGFSHRYAIATRSAYKGNRPAEKPTHLKACRERLKSRFNAIQCVGEADDEVSIEAASLGDGRYVVCSIDGDLEQIPGLYYNYGKKEEKLISKKEAIINLYCQILSGDSSDGVPGLTGIGPVKASKALADCRSAKQCWDVAVNMYRAEFGPDGDKYALECARLVYLLKQPGELWCPPEKT